MNNTSTLKLILFTFLFLVRYSAGAQEPGQAYYFTGAVAGKGSVQALIDNPHANGQPGPFDFSTGTVEGWIRPDFNNPTDDPYIFSMIQWWGTRWGITIGKDYGSIGVHGTGSSWLIYKFERGHWYHIAAVFNPAGNVTIYVNGNSIGTSTSTVNTSTTGTPFKIGIGWSWNSDGFVGAVDEVRVWNVERSATEIKTNMGNTVLPTSTGLLAYYKFNTAATGILPDATSNLLNGNIGVWENDAVAPMATPNWVESYAMAMPQLQAPTNVSSTSFTANWQSSNVGTTNSYIIDVATDNLFHNKVSGFDGLDVGNLLSKEITGLTANTTYYYRVRANKTSVTGQGAFAVSSINPSNVLPLDFISFSATKANNAVELRWETANEINTSHFNIMHSTNGVDWTSVDRVSAKGKVNNSYSYKHLKPIVGSNYYKLQQVDTNGDFDYSKERNVAFALASTSVSIYPNPVAEELKVQLPFASKSVAYVIYNSIGQKVMRGQLQSADAVVDVRKLPKGFYTIKIAEESPLKIVKK